MREVPPDNFVFNNARFNLINYFQHVSLPLPSALDKSFSTNFGSTFTIYTHYPHGSVGAVAPRLVFLTSQKLSLWITLMESNFIWSGSSSFQSDTYFTFGLLAIRAAVVRLFTSKRYDCIVVGHPFRHRRRQRTNKRPPSTKKNLYSSFWIS